MNRLAQNVLNYAMHFVVLYVALCVLLGSALSLLALIVGGFLYFSLEATWIADSGASLGGVGIGLSVAFIGSFVLAIIGTFWVAPSERNRRRDYAEYSLGILSDLSRPGNRPKHDVIDNRKDLRSAD